MVPKLMYLPVKWVEWFSKGKITPYEALVWVEKETAAWTDREQLTVALMKSWLTASCFKGTERAKRAINAISLKYIDFVSEHADEWIEGRFKQCFKISTDTRTPAPVEQNREKETQHQNMGWEQMAQAFLAGTGAQKRATETVVQSGTKFNDEQMARLQGWCNLKRTERHQIPEIWVKLQKCRNTADARAALIKHFDNLPEVVDIHFTTTLVKTLLDLDLSPASVPVYNTSHLGITPLAIPILSVLEQWQAAEEEEDLGKATNTTVADVRRIKKGPPPRPTTLQDLLDLLNQYVVFLRELFTRKCEHYKKVVYLRDVLKIKSNV